MTDVAVIGAGIVGVCCALSLQEAGKKVLLIDQWDPGEGASYGNAGVISPWSVVPQALPGVWRRVPGWLLNPDGPLSISPRHALTLLPWLFRFLRRSSIDNVRAAADAMESLNHDNIDLFRRHLAGTGQEHLIADSYYVHAFRRDAREQLAALEYALRREKGGEVAYVEGAEVHRLEPALSPDFKSAILVKGQARARSPGLICKTLAKKFFANGGEFKKTKVLGMTSASGTGWYIQTEDGEVSAPNIVLSAGAWSAELLKPLGVSVPLAIERGYHVQFPNPGVTLTHSVMDTDFKFVASSMIDGLRMAGTAEFAGLNTPPNHRRSATIARLARRLLPDLQTDGAETWMGMRPSFPDSLPMLGEVAGQKGLYAAFGHCHYGLMMAPKSGEIIAGLVTGQTSNRDLSPFSCERFQ